MQNFATVYSTDSTTPVTNDGLTYEFTEDRDYRSQYYQIRESCYKRHWGLKVFSGAEDSHDQQGDILIVRDGRKVVGGGRVVYRHSDETQKLLPMETEQFLLHTAVPEIGADRMLLGEIGRVAILPEYQGQKASKIGICLLARAQACGCRYVTTVAPVHQALTYIRKAKYYGIDIQMLEGVPVADHPFYNHIDMKLLFCDIGSSELKSLPDFRFLLQE